MPNGEIVHSQRIEFLKNRLSKFKIASQLLSYVLLAEALALAIGWSAVAEHVAMVVALVALQFFLLYFCLSQATRTKRRLKMRAFRELFLSAGFSEDFTQARADRLSFAFANKFTQQESSLTLLCLTTAATKSRPSLIDQVLALLELDAGAFLIMIKGAFAPERLRPSAPNAAGITNTLDADEIKILYDGKRSHEAMIAQFVSLACQARPVVQTSAEVADELLFNAILANPDFQQNRSIES